MLPSSKTIPIYKGRQKVLYTLQFLSYLSERVKVRGVVFGKKKKGRRGEIFIISISHMLAENIKGKGIKW